MSIVELLLSAIGQHLVEQRQALGVSQRELAERLGCRPNTVMDREKALYQNTALKDLIATVKALQK